MVRGEIWNLEMTDIAKGHGPEKIVGIHMKRVSKVMSINLIQIRSILSERCQLGGLPRITREEAPQQLKKGIRKDPVLLEPLENKLDSIKKRCS